MKQFIEIPQQANNILINIKHIFEVEKIPNGTRISLAINGHHDYPFLTKETTLQYEEVLKLIKDAL